MQKTEYPLEIVSLHNISKAYIDRRKTALTPLHNAADGSKAYYWKDDPQGKIPEEKDIHAAYAQALECGVSIPENVKTLYQKTITTEGKQGRARKSISEKNLHGSFAVTLHAIAKFEKETKANFFPIKTCKAAREAFFLYAMGREAPETTGSRDSYYRLVAPEKEENAEIIDKMCAILHKYYTQGKICINAEREMPQNTEHISTVEQVSYFGRDLFLYDSCDLAVWKHKK